MTARSWPLGGYFARPLALHITALMALGVMELQDMSVLGGRNTLVMMAIVQAAALALHGLAWARAGRLSASAKSVLVVLALLGSLYTLLVFALYTFAVTQQTVLQAGPLVLVAICLGCMWLALSRP